jgi:hypothetical protein
MTAVVSEIVGILVAGITDLASGIGGGLSALVSEIFLETVGTGETATTQLSVFGGVICIFAGVSLCIGLSRFVVNWVTSFGN